MAGYLTLKGEAHTELTEKRSVFYAHARPVTTEEDALAFLREIRTRYADATHNVYAYVLRERNLSRFSDDGEPHGTAGLPVLDVLRKNNVCDAILIVTRYFGGILLGTGGLVRAYSASAKQAMDAAGIGQCRPYVCFRTVCDYPFLAKLQSLLALRGVSTPQTDFAERVTLTARIPEEDFVSLCDAVREASAGRVMPEALETIYAF